MLAKHKGVCKRTHRCVIYPGDMVESYNGGWAHVACHNKRGRLLHSSVKPAGVKPVGNVTVCSCGGDILDHNADGGSCERCRKYYGYTMDDYKSYWT